MVNTFCFDESHYQDAEFASIKETGLNFSEIDFSCCTFKSCSITASKFVNCRFENCVFVDCDLSSCKLTDSQFVNPIFKSSKLIGIDWTLVQPIYTKIEFHDCMINYSNFFGLKLQRMEIINCTAKEVDFTETDLTKAIFSGTDLTASVFENTDLTQADLSQATNYTINANINRLKKTIFSLPEAASLLNTFDIILK